MKKSHLILLTIFSILTLTACGASNGAGPASEPQGGSNAGALPAGTQIIIGTMKLEGSAQAVTAKQAAELLPLWQTMKVLSASDTAAQQEKDALITQIQETMTAGQMQAIQNMNLTRQDMASIMQEQGRAVGSSSNSNSQSGNSSSNRNRGFGQGGGGFFPAGGGPPDERGGSGFAGQGQNLSREQIATAQAARQANENVVPPLLINAVIDYLQKKASS
ncbi:MAG TPA: hypothetical protein VLE49_06695 [Anaerolineales bacterium]|nr:hypothetical protein [Anaerolineales bacterium]